MVERPKKKYDEIMYALIKGDEVFNCIVSSPEFADELQKSGDYDAVILVGERERPSPGWRWDGTKWHRPEPEPSVERSADSFEAEKPEEKPKPTEPTTEQHNPDSVLNTDINPEAGNE